MRPLFCCAIFLLSAQALYGSCFQGLDQQAVATTVPIIVQGEVVRIDTAKAEMVQGKARRYLDLAYIKITKVYKNSLTDTPAEEKGAVAAWMNSFDNTVPGSQDKEGRVLSLSISTDIAYKVGRKAIWFVFLAKDGKFYINRHPQQRMPIEKENELLKAGILAPERERKVTREEFIRQISDLGGGRNITARIVQSGEQSRQDARDAFAKIHKELTSAKEAWQSIPWHLSLLEARAQAAIEKKPVYMLCRAGHPLGCV